MNAPLLLEAANSTDDSRGRMLRTRGLQHMVTIASHFARSDGSTAHRLVFDGRTGRLIGPTPGQGLRSSSTWSRGQAWAIYGFARAYSLTHDPKLLAAATAAADFWLRTVPTSCVAPWDFDATGRHVLFDSSASTIAASGLLHLAQAAPTTPGRLEYRTLALATLAKLVQPDWTPRTSSSPGLLQHQSWDVPSLPREGSYVWGDAYLLQALVRDLPSGLAR